MLVNAHVAAATAVVGYDLLQNERMNVSSQPRILRGVALVGSTNVDDAAVDIYIENFYVGRFYNTHAGVIQVDAQSDIMPVGPHAVPAGSKLSAIVFDAPAGNPVNLVLY